jgi:hypothetical protein
MSISFKKVNTMIADVVEGSDDINSGQKKVLAEVCQRVYMIESSIEYTSNSQVISEVKGEVSLKANDFDEEGET